MLGKNVAALLLKTPKALLTPKRAFAQVGHVIVTPPRVRVSMGEKIVHGAIMMTVWFTPVFYFLTQLKVWRRAYIEG